MRRARFFVRWIYGAAAIASFAVGPTGCSADSLAGTSPRESTNADAPIDAGAGDPLFAVCSDGQILAILAAEFSARVDLASAVRPSLGSAGALDLADKILTDDAVLEVQVQGEIRETGIASAPGGVDREIAAEAQWAIQALAAERAPAIDASYVDGEVLGHLRALALIDRLLTPSVHDPRVADLLGRVRNGVAQDAQAAVAAQSQLQGACAGQPD
jgi:hypothetical protein